MKPSLLLLSHLCLLSLMPLSWASDSAQGTSSLTCWYDSRAALFCDWDPGRDLAEAPCQLEILSEKGFCDSLLELHPSPEKRKKHCKLPKAEHMTGLRRCIKTFHQNVNNQCFTISDRLSFSVHCHTGEKKNKIPVQIKDFSPFENIKLRPPGNLQLANITENTSNLTWSLNISSHYLDGMREYQVRYRHVSQSWEEAANFPIEQDQMWVNFEGLSPNSKYEAAVRARPSARSNYKGVWSDWSKPVLWRTHPDHKGTSQPVLPVLIVSTLVFVIIGTAFLINPRTLKWFKKILKIHIPDPEKFFPPLVSVHGGDIQKWLSSPFSTSSLCVNNTTPEISVLEVMQKNDQESQFLLSKGTLTPDPPAETSVHSGSSCFTNQGYFFFHLSNSFEIEPCQVYFTYEPFTQEGSGSKDGECYQALPSPDLCTLAEDMDGLPSSFFHCVEATQGFPNSSLLEETAGEARQATAAPGALQSSEGTSPTPALEQDEKVMDKAVSQPAEAVCQLDTGFPDPLELQDSDTGGVREGSEKGSPPTDPCTPAANATSSCSQPPPLRQDEDLCHTAFSSQVPNTGAYFSLRDLQSQYSSHCSV
ncbi:PREDICTED: interleukin-2 receptor subunit beta [Ficedula albicollis]|uniref:Interleukin-2 receptor subunit beta n=1 Tax=Ficedula albicollis TaxID=59894 RepID=A0A803VPU9_FICAL|nr:PREDICTED: interleukin-2 receptor subunit beta [Ficedula albicollis]